MFRGAELSGLNVRLLLTFGRSSGCAGPRTTQQYGGSITRSTVRPRSGAELHRIRTETGRRPPGRVLTKLSTISPRPPPGARSNQLTESLFKRLSSTVRLAGADLGRTASPSRSRRSPTFLAPITG